MNNDKRERRERSRLKTDINNIILISDRQSVHMGAHSSEGLVENITDMARLERRKQLNVPRQIILR